VNPVEFSALFEQVETGGGAHRRIQQLSLLAL